MDHHKKSVNKFTADDRFFSAIGRFFLSFHNSNIPSSTTSPSRST
jgi:hypothetical protein